MFYSSEGPGSDVGESLLGDHLNSRVGKRKGGMRMAKQRMHFPTAVLVNLDLRSAP